MTRSLWKGTIVHKKLLKLFNVFLFSKNEKLKLNDKIQQKLANYWTPIKLNSILLFKTKLNKNLIINKLKLKKKKKKLKKVKLILKNIYFRKSIIRKNFLNLIFYIHTGLMYKKRLINSLMIGHKFGEFATTRRIMTK